MTIVGYNDDEGYFIVKNSWGTDWGEGGYFRIAYNDPSGVGRSNNYAVEIANPEALVKIQSPSGFAAARDTLSLQAGTSRKLSEDLFYRVSNEFGDTVSGLIDPARMSTQVDVSQLPNGVYDLELNATETDRRMGPTWFQRLVVVNTEPNLTLELEPDFDPSERSFARTGSTMATKTSPWGWGLPSLSMKLTCTTMDLWARVKPGSSAMVALLSYCQS